jgi:pilus assembly protein Flp/PilA
MCHLFRRVNRDEWGATATEYALLVSLVALVIIGSVAALGSSLANFYDGACDDIVGATVGTDC